MPITKVFTPEHADDDTREKMAVVEKALADEHTQAKVSGLLKEYGAQALIIAPEHNETRRAEAGSDYVMFVLKGQRPMTDTGLTALARKVGEIIGVDKSVSFLFDRNSEAGIGRSYKLREGEENPVTRVLSELDSRGASRKHG